MVSNRVGEMSGKPRGMGQGFFVGTVEDPIAAGLRVSARSFGLGGTFGKQVWIDRKEKNRDDPDDPERAGQ